MGAAQHETGLDSVAKRLQFIVDELKIDGVILGRYAGVSKQAARKWLTGESKSLNAVHLYMIEDRTKFSARWIAIGKGPMMARDVAVLSDDELAMVLAYRSHKKAIEEGSHP